MTGVPPDCLTLFEAYREFEAAHEEAFGPVDPPAGIEALARAEQRAKETDGDVWAIYSADPSVQEAERRKNGRLADFFMAIYATPALVDVFYTEDNGQERRIPGPGFHDVGGRHMEEWLFTSHTIPALGESINPFAGRMAYVKTKQFRDWMRGALSELWQQEHETPLEAAPKPKSTRGRKSPYDWIAFENELTRLFNYHGGFHPSDPEFRRPADAVRKMKKWCEREWGKAPGKSTLFERVSLFIETRNARTD